MAVAPKIPGNMKTNTRANIPVSGGSQNQVVIATAPEFATAIMVASNLLATKKVELTSDARLSTGLPIDDMEDSGVLWAEVAGSANTTYFSGDQKLITGVRITSLNAVSAIEYSVTQVKD